MEIEERPPRVMTYISHGKGIDRRLDLDRTARVIRDAGVGVAGLQKVPLAVRLGVPLRVHKRRLDHLFGRGTHWRTSHEQFVRASRNASGISR